MAVRRYGVVVGVCLLLAPACSTDRLGDPFNGAENERAGGRDALECVTDSQAGRDCRVQWSRKVATEAGYRIVSNTGTAWVAEGRGDSFYIWATRVAPTRHLRAEGYRTAGRVAGTQIYADNVRIAWRAQRLTVWISAGPRATSVAPERTELGPLVRASKAVAIE